MARLLLRRALDSQALSPSLLRRLHGSPEAQHPNIFQFFDSLKPAPKRLTPLQFYSHASGRAQFLRTSNNSNGGRSSSARSSAPSAPAPAPAPQIAVSSTPSSTGVVPSLPPLASHVPLALPAGMVESDLLSSSFGEDSYFVRSDALGVADGVGGWSEANPGVSSQLYSRLLMHHVAAQLERSAQYPTAETPIELLEFAAAQSAQALGSSTALVVLLRDSMLHFAQLGDCGALVLRNGQTAFRTQDQQHSFNFPYQLGASTRTKASDATISAIQTARNDILVVGSDGLFDNLFDHEIVAIVQRHTVRTQSDTVIPIDARAVAEALVLEAYDASCDRRRSTPFESRAISNGLMFEGGKIDDISVIVAVVVEAEDSPDRR